MSLVEIVYFVHQLCGKSIWPLGFWELAASIPSRLEGFPEPCIALMPHSLVTYHQPKRSFRKGPKIALSLEEMLSAGSFG